MTITPPGEFAEGGWWARWSFRDLLRPITSIQFKGLLVFLILSATDVILSVYLIYGAGGGYVEGNPVLAWASGALKIFLVVTLAVKVLGAGLIALMVSIANHISTLVGNATVLAAVGTTATYLLIYTVGAASTLLAAIGR